MKIQTPKILFSILLATLPIIAFADIRKSATITSEPSGAKVWMNNVYRGKTPVEIPFNWNWYYDFKIEKDGYETLISRERFKAPAKHLIPVDLFKEAIPTKSQEQQWRHYVLKPAKK